MKNLLLTVLFITAAKFSIGQTSFTLNQDTMAIAINNAFAFINSNFDSIQIHHFKEIAKEKEDTVAYFIAKDIPNAVIRSYDIYEKQKNTYQSFIALNKSNGHIKFYPGDSVKKTYCFMNIYPLSKSHNLYTLKITTHSKASDLEYSGELFFEFDPNFNVISFYYTESIV